MKTRAEVELGASLCVLQHAMYGLTIEILHGQKVATTRLTHFQRLHEIRMVQTRSHTRFIEEHLHELGVLTEFALEHLDDQQFLKLRGSARTFGHRQIDIRHPPASDVRDQSIATECV